MVINFRYVVPYLSQMFRGLSVSIMLTLIVIFLGLLVGLLAYSAKASPYKPVSIIAKTYIEIIRNTPLLVQLYMIYFGLAQIGIDTKPFQATIIALVFNCGAYTSEIIRAGFKAVNHGTIEAGYALGMNKVQIFFNVRLPPAMKSCFPALINQFVMMFLGTSIASVISLKELTYITLNVNSFTARTVEVFFITGVMYYVTSVIMINVLRKVESSIFTW